MFWGILLVIVLIISAMLDTIWGKIVVGSVVLSFGLMLLSWITGIGIFMTLVKILCVVIVVVTTITILIAIIN